MGDDPAATAARVGKLSGKVAVVTGAGQGIGAGTARALAKEGASVALAGRTFEKVAQVAGEISADGHRAVAYVCDVTVPDAITAMFAKVREDLGPPDILINNAPGWERRDPWPLVPRGSDL